ncbi:MAG: hypothetical protein SNI70_09555 [Rikenellaceae bacterium]
MIKKFFKSLLSDESGAISSKRVMGIVACFVLFYLAVAPTLTESVNTPNDPIVWGVVYIALGCLGLSSVDKFSHK